MPTIRGQIIDQTTGDSLPFAYIELINENIGGNTDLNGNFILRVNSGNYNVLVRYIGFEEKKIENVEVFNDRSLFIKLKPKTTELQPLTIESKRTYIGFVVGGVLLGIIYILSKIKA
jgi:hypothetical protein